MIALSAYEAADPVSFFAPNDPTDAGVITISGDRGGRPVVLVLSAADPVIWDLRQVPKRRLRGIVAYGESAQAVVGVPASLPVRFATRRVANLRCGLAFGGYEGRVGLDRFSATVAMAVGRPVDAFYGGYAPQGLNIDGKTAPRSQAGSITLDMLFGSEKFSVGSIPPKDKGIAMLVRQGSIRAATTADWTALDAKLQATSLTGYVVPHWRMAGRVFVVLKAITVPRGMYGANSATFLIAKGVAVPVDPGSHNSYYRLDDGRCVGGPTCPSGI